MVLDHLGHGINVRDDPKILLSPYIAFMDRLVSMRLAKPKLRSAFFVGGGAYTLPRAWRARYPGSRLVVAEIDPAVTRAARARMWVAARDVAGVLHMDARVALARAVPDGSMDVVVGDAFRDIAVPTHLVTAEFAALVRRKLRPHGFYMMNVVDGTRQPRLAASLAKTLARAFASVELWMELKQLRAGGRVTFVAVAGARPTPGDGRVVLGPAGDGVWLRWPPGDLRRLILDPKVPVLSDDYAPVDRLILDVIRAPK
jgi:spermidine synthase